LALPKPLPAAVEGADRPLSPNLSSKTILNLLPVRKNSPGSADQRKSDRERTTSAGSIAESGMRRKSDNGVGEAASPVPAAQPAKKGSSTLRFATEL
jgi:hypothetical protein